MVKALTERDFDVCQRYAELRRVLDACLGPVGAAPFTVLDLGSGNDHYTQVALGPDYRVVRADVEADDPDVLLLKPDGYLPFADGAFDAVVAMDVLEHVPAAQRPAFLQEGMRVTRGVFVVAFPPNLEAVRAAEQRYAALHENLRGSHRYLAEHAAHGLPDLAAVRELLVAAGATVVERDNNPLALWEAFSTLDLLAYDDERAFPLTVGLHQRQNASFASRRPGVVHYRKMLIASRDRRLVAGLEQLDSSLTESHAPPTDALAALAHVAIDLLKEWHAALDRGNALEAERRVLGERLEKAARDAETEARLSSRIAALENDLEDRAAAIHWRDVEIDSLREVKHALEREAVGLRAGRQKAEASLSAWHSSREGRVARRLGRLEARARRGTRRLLRRGFWRCLLVADSTKRRLLLRLEDSPLFDEGFYLAQNPDVGKKRLWAARHYLEFGGLEGRDPHPLFDSDFYRSRYPDVADARVNPLVHYLYCGAAEGRDPHPLFDSRFYREHNPDVAAAGVDPLMHYLAAGAAEGRDPGPRFETAFYRKANPDVAAAGANPLVHYVVHGIREGRKPRRFDPAAPEAGGGYRLPAGLLPWFTPLNLSVREDLTLSPRLNLLLPSLALRHMSGGPNTAIALGLHIAAAGVPLRLISTDVALGEDPEPFLRHAFGVAGIEAADVEIVDASDRGKTTVVGAQDVFLATAWWTAQMARDATRLTEIPRFLYLIQDFEALLHPASSAQALALETYAFDHVPIVNTGILRDHLAREAVGRFADPAFAKSAIVIEPAVDRRHFHFVRRGKERSRLLFYARPATGVRNLFELGVAALHKALHDGVFDPGAWEFLGIGDAFEPMSLTEDAVLKPTPWLTFEGYASLMRESDVLLSLMLSPHPSYPPLEMAACGRPVVTTSFGAKTAERLASLSPNIIAVAPTIEGVSEGLRLAVCRAKAMADDPNPPGIGLPATWSEAISPAMPRILESLADTALCRRTASSIPVR